MNLENTVKSLILNEGKSAVIYNDDTLNNPKDPTVLVSNYGTMRLSHLQKKITDEIKGLSKFSDKPSALLMQIGILQQSTEALKDIQDEMKSTQFKKKTK
jgi:hypothetical protein